MDKARASECRASSATETYTRASVYRDDWDTLVKVFEGIATCDVTRRRLVLSNTRDSTTGWRSKSYSEETIKGILIPRGATQLALKAGTYVKLDAVFLTIDPLDKGDEIKLEDNIYYEVKTVQEHWVGNNFVKRDCDLTHLPFPE